MRMHMDLSIQRARPELDALLEAGQSEAWFARWSTIVEESWLDYAEVPLGERGKHKGHGMPHYRVLPTDTPFKAATDPVPALDPASCTPTAAPGPRYPAILTAKLKLARRARDLACKLKHGSFPSSEAWPRPWHALWRSIVISELAGPFSHVLCERFELGALSGHQAYVALQSCALRLSKELRSEHSAHLFRQTQGEAGDLVRHRRHRQSLQVPALRPCRWPLYPQGRGWTHRRSLSH